MIELNNINVSFKQKIVFKNMSLKLNKGKYEVVGKNGVGKTTLFKTIFKNCDNVVYMKQTPVFLENLNVIDNVNYLCDNSKDCLSILSKFTINLKSKVIKLSGGQRQIINFFINYYNDGLIYLFDEPFNNLDKKFIKLVYDLIFEMDKLVIVIDHQDNFNFKKLGIKNFGVYE